MKTYSFEEFKEEVKNARTMDIIATISLCALELGQREHKRGI
jgi:hypothetical protein